MLLTRLLLPDMFGLMAVANTLIFGLHLFSDVGLGQSLIQSKRGDDPEFINTVWTAQVVRGFLITLLGLLLAIGVYVLNLMHVWPSNAVYAEPILPIIIAVSSMNALITGFASTKSALANRNLTIGRNTLIDFISQITGILITVIWAYIDKSVWALVGGSIISSMLGVVMGHKLLPGVNNKFYWDRHAFKEIFHFGKWIFLTSILGFLSGSGDRLILGGLIDAKTLGLYATAFFLANAIQDILYKIASSIGFPAFSEVRRERPEQLKQVYYKLRRFFDMISLTATGFLFVAGHLIVEFLYDDRYIPAGHMLEILSIGFIAVRYGLAEQCYMAIGKPGYNAPLIGIRMLVIFLLVPIAFKFYGLDGALWIIGGNALASLPLAIYFKIKNDLFDLRQELIVLPFLVVGLLLGELTVWLLHLLNISF